MLVDGEVLARVTHVWLAAVAVSGVVMATLALRAGEAELPERSRRRLLRSGALLALVATLGQIPVGVWVALEMPETMRAPLLGGDWLATGLFLAALMCAVQLLYALLSMALGDHEPRQVRRSALLLAIVMLLMVGTRQRLAERATAPLAPPIAGGVGLSLLRAEVGIQ
jgi:hypothetical protein